MHRGTSARRTGSSHMSWWTRARISFWGITRRNLKGIELYKGKVIVYAPGHVANGHNHPDWPDNYLVRFTLGKKAVTQVEVLPIAGKGQALGATLVTGRRRGASGAGECAEAVRRAGYRDEYERKCGTDSSLRALVRNRSRSPGCHRNGGFLGSRGRGKAELPSAFWVACRAGGVCNRRRGTLR